MPGDAATTMRMAQRSVGESLIVADIRRLDRPVLNDRELQEHYADLDRQAATELPRLIPPVARAVDRHNGREHRQGRTARTARRHPGGGRRRGRGVLGREVGRDPGRLQHRVGAGRGRVTPGPRSRSTAYEHGLQARRGSREATVVPVVTSTTMEQLPTSTSVSCLNFVNVNYHETERKLMMMSLDTMHLARLLTAASPAAQDHVVRVLEQDHADQAWGAQIGPGLTQADVARLLNVTVQAVSKNKGLLRLENRDGRPVYPIIQFDGRRALPGVADIVAILDGPLLPLTTASWLTSTNKALAGRTAIEALRAGDLELVEALARQTAAAAA